VIFWTLINFAMFVGLLTWGLVKFAPSFFEARSLDIQKAIKDATGLKIEADFRYSEIDKQMANLPAEMERLKSEARSNMQQVHASMLEETRQDEARIRASAAAEIAALQQQGQQEVRLLAAQRAFGLAEKRLAERYASSDSGDMLREFANLVERGKN